VTRHEKRPTAGDAAINATVIYVVAFILTTVVTSWRTRSRSLALGGKPVALQPRREQRRAPDRRVIAVKLAGPVVSLFRRGAHAAVLRSSPARPDAALVPLADGARLQQLPRLLFTASPPPVTSAPPRASPSCDAGDRRAIPGRDGTQLAVIWHLRRPFLSFAFDEAQLSDRDGRKREMLHVLMAPSSTDRSCSRCCRSRRRRRFSLVYPLMSGMPFIMPWQAAANPNTRAGVVASDGQAAVFVSWLAIAVLVALAAFNQFVLKPGIAL
jgi:hypothetical protein